MGIRPGASRSCPGFYTGESYLNLLTDTANFCSKSLTASVLCAIYWAAIKYLRQIDSSHVSGIPIRAAICVNPTASSHGEAMDVMTVSDRINTLRIRPCNVSIFVSKVDRLTEVDTLAKRLTLLLSSEYRLDTLHDVKEKMKPDTLDILISTFVLKYRCGIRTLTYQTTGFATSPFLRTFHRRE